jgi:prepilin-type N-terminal cleavage/methylation domain-containing protein
MSTLKRLHSQARARRQGKPAFTLLELIVVLLVLGILAAIAVPTFNRVKENSVTRVAQTTLEAIDRNGEAIAISDQNMSDEQIAAAALAEMPTQPGLTITRDGAEITVENSSGSIVASGTVTFSNGVGTIVPATVGGSGGGSGSSSTTSTTVAPAVSTVPVSVSASYVTVPYAAYGLSVTLNVPFNVTWTTSTGGACTPPTVDSNIGAYHWIRGVSSGKFVLGNNVSTGNTLANAVVNNTTFFDVLRVNATPSVQAYPAGSNINDLMSWAVSSDTTADPTGEQWQLVAIKLRYYDEAAGWADCSQDVVFTTPSPAFSFPPIP